MDETSKHYNPNPIISSNPISTLFFWWLNPLFKTGYKRRLEVDDMFNVCDQDSSEVLGDRLEKEWNKEMEKLKIGGKPNLLKCLIRMFGVKYCLLGIFVFVEEGTKIAQPLLLGQLIRFFTPKSTISRTQAYLYALGISVCAIILAVFHHPYFFGVQRLGMQLRVACCSLLYRKCLRLSNAALGHTTTGQIVNLMSNDVNRFDTSILFLHYVWIGPVQAIPVLIILWHELGPSALAGFGVLLLLVPLQSYMGKLFSRYRYKTALHTDERVKVMNEIISGMRVIKMYCWEKPFAEIVRKIRRQERRYVMASKKVWSYTRQVWLYGPRFMYFCTIVPAALSGVTLESERLYICIPLIYVVAQNILGSIPHLIHDLAEAWITLRRLQKFLLLEELNEVDNLEQTAPSTPGGNSLSISNITAKWDLESEQPTLSNINVQIDAGKLLVVIGPVGAGKSSFLMSLLGEIPVVDGNIKLQGRISYISQQPWVFSASLRQNIVFGNNFNQQKYNRILTACALKKDIDFMPHGDSTLIGDRGLSLSGGQRARVSLARALYMDADVYLLDDPLSAVDTSVGRHLFDRVINGILKNKTRILVTHQLHFLKAADGILILKEGKCLGQGTFEELTKSDLNFSTLLQPKKEEAANGYEKKICDLQETKSNQNPGSTTIGSMLSLTSIENDFEHDTLQLTEQEERKEGQIGWKVYFEYFKNGGGPCKFLILLLINVMTQGLYIMSDWWLTLWSNEEEEKHAATVKDSTLRFAGYNITNVTIPDVNTFNNVYVFTGIIASVFVFGLLRALMFFKIAIDSAMNLHTKMFNNLLRTPISFFDTNPVGRILNRFSKDIGHLDDMLPITMFDFLQCFFLVVGIILVVGIKIPWVFLPLLPVAILFTCIRRYYIRTSRHIKRLEGTTRSPVFTHLSASLQGLHTIRASGVKDKFKEEFDDHQNLHTESWFLLLATNRWLAVRLDWMCATFVTIVAFLSVIVSNSLDAGSVGLCLTYAMNLMGMFQWAVRQSAEVENQMISVERVLEYSKLPNEAPLTSDEKSKPAADWPDHGKIVCKNVCLRYSQTGPLVLNDINFCIESKEKIGIVGRTGAGKSSLIAVLFRMVEPDGNILIDYINIQKIGLHELRSKISIIPQDPVLFNCSLRMNLDPFQDHDDSSVWSALEGVQLKTIVDDLPNKLATVVSEGGLNFSVGQRQLLCLARAILRRNKILMIDEATANVDHRTDALIQRTIKEKFKNCTVLTVAHRLNTIMDSDRVMVMDDGKIMEFDHPFVLLQIENGYFTKMVHQTGSNDAEYLINAAKDAFLTSRQK